MLSSAVCQSGVIQDTNYKLQIPLSPLKSHLLNTQALGQQQHEPERQITRFFS